MLASAALAGPGSPWPVGDMPIWPSLLVLAQLPPFYRFTIAINLNLFISQSRKKINKNLCGIARQTHSLTPCRLRFFLAFSLKKLDFLCGYDMRP
jgi:hypothetical protein